MEKFTPENIAIFILFFLPGFLSLKVYEMLIASEKTDFSKAIIETVAYSVLNLGFFSPLIFFCLKYEWYNDSIIPFVILLLFVLLIMPITWPVLISILRTRKFMVKFIVHPIGKPWDYVFQKRETYWMIVNLKNGIKIAGRYGLESFASSYPYQEQIYLEEVWNLNDQNQFDSPIDNSKGIIILGDDISSIELIQ